MSMYKHVSCNMQEFWKFSIHATCIKCDMHVIVTFMLCANDVHRISMATGVSVVPGII